MSSSATVNFGVSNDEFITNSIVSGSIFSTIGTKNVFFVDHKTTYPVNAQVGSVIYPFSTIQKAIDAVPQPQNADQMRNTYYILIFDGEYDEDLVINGTLKRICLYALGSVTLGKMTGSSWTPSVSDIRRNITWNCSDPATFPFSNGIRNGLSIDSLIPMDGGMTTNQSYLTKFRISGNIIMNYTGSSSNEFHFNGEVFGNIDLSANGTAQVYIYNSRIRGNFIGGTNTQLQELFYSRIDGTLTTGAYSDISHTQFNGNITVSSAGNAGIQPDGFKECSFNGPAGQSFTGPAGSLRLDTYTNYWVVNKPLVLNGGATKLLYYSIA